MLVNRHLATVQQSQQDLLELAIHSQQDYQTKVGLIAEVKQILHNFGNIYFGFHLLDELLVGL